MTLYTVTWEIQIDAETREAAAKKALEIHRDPNSTATIFNVYDEKEGKQIDVAWLDDGQSTVTWKDLEKSAKRYMATCTQDDDEGPGMSSATLIAEATAHNFGHPEWLDHLDHPIWDAAVDAIHDAE